jgi:hypothetical protein
MRSPVHVVSPTGAVGGGGGGGLVDFETETNRESRKAFNPI